MIMMSSALLTACQPAPKTQPPKEQPPSNVETPTRQPSQTLITINWKKIDSGIKPANTKTYVYPFALDSHAVKTYADFHKVDNKTAQHNITIGMAVNELLSKILDQIDTAYVSHELTSGKQSKLIIHTTKNVTASEYDYVISDEFAKGLILPVQIVPDKIKEPTNSSH